VPKSLAGSPQLPLSQSINRMIFLFPWNLSSSSVSQFKDKRILLSLRSLWVRQHGVKARFNSAIAFPKLGKLCLLSNNGSLYYGLVNQDIYFSSEFYPLSKGLCTYFYYSNC
jgi:hypothetical protein